MNWNFDTITNRQGTNAIKHDLAKARKKPEDVLSLWVADMDFPTAPCIQKALSEKAVHGIYGYSRPDDRYYQALLRWYQERFNYTIEKDWVVNTPGVVFAISAAIQAFSREGDGVLIQKPVYYPFFNMINALHRTVVNSPLELRDARYEINFEDFERKIIENKVKLFILCSPHNPGGRVWTLEELRKMSEICLKHQVLVVSDEIHSDITFDGHTHHIYGALSKDAEQNCIICTAPSKSFNLAGLQFSNIIVPNEKLREQLQTQIDLTGYDEPSLMGIVAATAAYAEGGPWFDAVKSYIWDNIQFAVSYIQQRNPKIRPMIPEGTYLLWLDFSGTGLSDEEINHRILHMAKVWLDAGTMFGSEEGKYFQRINCATPRPVLEKALDAILSSMQENER